MNHDEFIHRISLDMREQDINGSPVLVALSGGADSVALLRVLLELGHDCRAAHCNFHLRGAESARDEQFVRQLCQQLNVPLTVKDFDVPAWQLEHGGSVEMACRTMRYHWFEQERNRQGCACIAVAHHANDQVETFFLNLTRGTGLRGLTGMERLNHKIWRPLLSVSRADILDYLAAIGQEYVTDSTNAQNEYRRNRLRNIVLPCIESQFPQGTKRILNTIENLSRDKALLATLVNETLPDDRHIDIKQLCALPEAPTLLFHRIRHMGFNREQCVDALEAARHNLAGRQFIGQGHLLVVNRRTIDIEPITCHSDIEIPIELTRDILCPVKMIVSRNNAPFSPLMCDGKRKVAFNDQLLDCQHIALRHWHRGDRFRPFGLKGTKLVSDLFADMKLDHAAKGDTWLLEADGDIIWVVGYRSSALYPVENGSQNYLFLELI